MLTQITEHGWELNSAVQVSCSSPLHVMLNHKMNCNNEWTEVKLSLNIGCYNLRGAVCFRIELRDRIMD